MKNIIDICEEFGIEIPADKQAGFGKAVSENYKTVAEVEKKIGKLETERDSYKQRAETAEETLKSFDGIDPAKMNEELESWKQKAAQAQKDAEAKIAERDFDDALKAEMEGYKFTSTAAKNAVTAEVRSAGLKLKDGKILGLSDLMAQIKESDPDAIVDERQQEMEQNKARFTKQSNKLPEPGTKLKPAELMKLKNEHPEIDIKQYM